MRWTVRVVGTQTAYLSIHPSIYQQWSPDTPVKASAFAICITGEARVVTKQGL